MEGNPTPPPQVAFVQYPRGQAPGFYGSSEKLERAYRGYMKLSLTFLWALLTNLCLLAGPVVLQGNQGLGLVVMLMTIPLISLAIYTGIKSCKDIGYSLDWTPSTGAALGIVCAIFGLIPIAVLQYLALGEMKRYGVKVGSFTGVRKKVVMAKIEELKALEQGPTFQSP